jgi:DNA-binding Lrp family transcriptional regulator
MNINKEKEQIVKTMNDLYILNRWKYLVLSANGTYSTIQYYKDNPELNKDNAKPLTDWRVYHHINSKQTLGVFAGKKNNVEISKFITFDIDIPDLEIAKWVAYKIINTLHDIGIDDDYIYISTSGNKGFHIDIFFTEPIAVDLLKKFYLYVLNKEELLNCEYGQVEFRPTYDQGVKIPLGRNFRNNDEFKNKCWFVDYSKGLKPIQKLDYILQIKKIDSILFQMILDKILDDTKEEQIQDNIEKYQYIKNKYTPLEIYKHNIEEDVTLEAIQKLEQEGLKRVGTRHNSLLKICKYYKYLGMSKEENKYSLIEWVQRQDENLYTSKWEEIIKDIDDIVSYVYVNNCSIVGGIEDVEITYSEMKEILKAKTKNEKLVLYALLVHSKRYATKQGIFYFPYSLMEKATNLTKKTLIKIIKQLEEQGKIKCISRNQNIINKGKWVGKESNKYNVLIKACEMDIDNIFIIHKNDDYIKSFSNCILTWYSDKEIKKICGRRHYEELVRYKEMVS